MNIPSCTRPQVVPNMYLQDTQGRYLEETRLYFHISMCIYLHAVLQASSGLLSVRGVRFVGGSPGPRELCFKYQDMRECVRIEVTAGPPVQLKLLEKSDMVCHTFTSRTLAFMEEDSLSKARLFSLCRLWTARAWTRRWSCSCVTNGEILHRTSGLKLWWRLWGHSWRYIWGREVCGYS